LRTNQEGKIKLSTREAQILTLLCCESLEYKEIGAALRISHRTVAGYVEEICSALRLPGKNLLLLWGWQHPAGRRGEWDDVKLHKPGCECEGELCSVLRRQVVVPEAA
jgi:DNA-binding CsgD family transcriptional regulator